MSDLLNDFFNPQVQVETTASETKTEFRPNYKKGKNGVYQAVIRFLPHPLDPANKSIIKKNVCYLENPITHAKQYIDCPPDGQPSIISDTFWALRNSDNAIKKEQSSQFSRKQKYASLIQVLACDADPSLVNKILVWSYGIKIQQKIYNEMHPAIGTPRNPFNLLTGRPFIVKVCEASGYSNYDQCEFCSVEGPDAVNYSFRLVTKNNLGQEQLIPVTDQLIATDQGRNLVINYLKENAPDTTPYEYHEWDAATTEFVNQCVQIYLHGYMPQQVAPQQQAMNTLGAQMNQPQAAGIPNVTPGMPGMPQMNVASLGDVLAKVSGGQVPQQVPQNSAPQTTQVPQGGMPQANPIPTMPNMGGTIPGLTLDAGIPTQQTAPQQAAPTMNASDIGLPNLSDVMNIGQQSSGNRGSEDAGGGISTAGLSLDGILQGNML